MKRKAVTLQLEGEIPQPQSAYNLAVEDGYEGSEEQYGKELATIPPTQEQFNVIPGRLSKLTNTTEKSDFHHITDSANMKVLDFGMEGKTEQKTTAGNQLFDASLMQDNTNGEVTVANNNDGTISLSGSGTMSNSVSWSYRLTHEETVSLLKVGTINLTTNNDGIYPFLYVNFTGSRTYGEMQLMPNNAGANKVEITQEMLDDSTFVMRYGFFGAAGQEIVSGTVRPMLYQDGDGTYEPYTNGPSPNPDYPQEIVNAGVYNEATGRYEIGCKVVNKNWFNKEWIKDGSTYDVQEGSYWRKYFYLEPNTTYRCVVKKPLHVDDSLYISFLAPATSDYDKQAANGIVTILDGKAMDKQVKFTTPEDGKMIIKTNNNGLNIFTATFEEIIDDEATQIMIYKLEGAVDDTYIPYEGQPFTLTSPVPLTKWDYLTKRDGVWGWSIWSGYNVFDGSDDEFWGYYAANNGTVMYTNKPNGVKGYLKSLCSHFTNVGTNVWDDKEAIGKYADHTNNTYSYFVTQYSSLEEWKAWLAENNMTFVYPTTQEQAFIPLPESEQTLLNNLETYYGVTNVYNDQGCPMWLTYVQDTKAAIDNKFNNIRQAVLSLGGNV